MDLVGHYLISLRADGRSEETLRWHDASLKQWMAWCDANAISSDPESWTVSDIRRYVVFTQNRTSDRTGKPLAGSSVNSLIRSLKAFCRWLLREELIARDLFAKVTVPKAPSLVIPTLSKTEIGAILRAARVSSYPLRDEAIIVLMLDTGARASEVCGLDLDAISWEHGIVRLFGKGRKQRYVPLSPKTAKLLQRYLFRTRGQDPGPFFLSERGERLTRWGLEQLFGRISVRAGIRVYPHLLRHTFATEYLRAGGNVFILQRVLGHTTLQVTLRYAQLVTDDLVDGHKQFSPITRLL